MYHILFKYIRRHLNVKLQLIFVGQTRQKSSDIIYRLFFILYFTMDYSETICVGAVRKVMSINMGCGIYCWKYDVYVGHILLCAPQL